MVAHPNGKKIAFITGANRGIGFEVARQLGWRGMAVIIGARDPQRGADAATILRSEGIDAHHMRLDVTDEHTICTAMQEVERAFGRLDVLVNNAGVALDRGMQPSAVPLDVLRRCGPQLLYLLAVRGVPLRRPSDGMAHPALDIRPQSRHNRIENRDDVEESIMMRNVSECFRHIREPVAMLLTLIVDVVRYLGLCLRPSPTLAAENLFLRKQLALYQERQVKLRRATNATRMALVWLGRWFVWRSALSIVTPETFTRWHRQGFRWFWRCKSKSGRPALPKDLQALIRRMALENLTWGQERIANELLLKLGLKVSPRTIRKYMPDHCVGGLGKRCSSQRWSTFVRNHAKGIIACDFCVAVAATFRILYIFVVIEHVSRQLLHVNVTAHPTAQWTVQQFREALPADHSYRILIHDRDTIFSKAVDQRVNHMGLHVIKTPVRSPVANSICERVIGSLRREYLDFVIPLNEKHLYGILKEWVTHYNESRPHMSLGPGIPRAIGELPALRQPHRHQMARGQGVVSRPILGGLHHDYRLEQKVA